MVSFTFHFQSSFDLFLFGKLLLYWFDFNNLLLDTFWILSETFVAFETFLVNFPSVAYLSGSVAFLLHSLLFNWCPFISFLGQVVSWSSFRSLLGRHFATSLSFTVTFTAVFGVTIADSASLGVSFGAILGALEASILVASITILGACFGAILKVSISAILGASIGEILGASIGEVLGASEPKSFSPPHFSD